ncbi:M48 family metalloprotease [Streptosporangium jomthongense]|uniref:M48 family metalloprotease n=1 Tax=Streptosporangium jomthongense TaxID=1193683 RepID=A0ABV8F4Y0_9ACTN
MRGLYVRMFVSLALLGALYAIPVAVALRCGVPSPVVAVLTALTVALQWFGTERLARRVAGARFVDAEREPELHAALDRLCALSGLPKPRVAISLDPVPNAFTVGRSRRHTTLIVTSGLLRVLEPDELAAALAHEIAHIRHRDVAVTTLAGSFAIALAWAGRGLGELFETGLPIAVAGVLIALARLPLRPLSRYREMAADRGAAVQLGRPALLASMLVKVHTTPRPRALRLPALGLVSSGPAHSMLVQRVNGLKSLARE